MEAIFGAMFLICILLFEGYRRQKKARGLLEDVRLLSDHAPRSKNHSVDHLGGSIKAKFGGRVVTFTVKLQEEGGPTRVRVKYDLPNWPHWLDVHVAFAQVQCNVGEISCLLQPLHALRHPDLNALRDGLSELFDYREYTAQARANGMMISFELDGEDARFVDRLIRQSIELIDSFYAQLPKDELAFWVHVYDNNPDHLIQGSALAYFGQLLLNEMTLSEEITKRVEGALQHMSPSLLVYAMIEAPSPFLAVLANVQWDVQRWLSVAAFAHIHEVSQVLRSYLIKSSAAQITIDDYESLLQHEQILLPMLKQVWADRPEDRVRLLSVVRPHLHRLSLDQVVQWVSLVARDAPESCSIDEFKVLHRPRVESFYHHLTTPFYQVIDADPEKMTDVAWCEMALLLMACFGDVHARSIFNAMSQYMPVKIFGPMSKALTIKDNARSALGVLLLDNQQAWRQRIDLQQGALSVAGDTGLVGGLSRAQDGGSLSMFEGDDV